MKFVSYIFWCVLLSLSVLAQSHPGNPLPSSELAASVEKVASLLQLLNLGDLIEAVKRIDASLRIGLVQISAKLDELASRSPAGKIVIDPAEVQAIQLQLDEMGKTLNNSAAQFEQFSDEVNRR